MVPEFVTGLSLKSLILNNSTGWALCFAECCWEDCAVRFPVSCCLCFLGLPWKWLSTNVHPTLSPRRQFARGHCSLQGLRQTIQWLPWIIDETWWNHQIRPTQHPIVIKGAMGPSTQVVTCSFSRREASPRPWEVDADIWYPTYPTYPMVPRSLQCSCLLKMIKQYKTW